MEKKFKVYIELEDEYHHIPSATIHLDDEGDICHFGCCGDFFDNLLSENLYEYDEDGATIQRKYLGDADNEKEWEEWYDNRKVGEILSGVDDYVWWDANKGKIEIINE